MMRRWMVIGLVLLVGLASAGGTGIARAQGDGETDTPLPACTASDLGPLVELMLPMYDAVLNASRFEVEEMLGWRAQLNEIAPPECAEGLEIWLQLRLAADELLIGTLLIERDSAQEGALAINQGLSALASLRFAIPGPLNPSSGFTIYTGDAVMASFAALGLPIDEITREAGPAGGGAPEGETERITFTLPTVFDGGVGQVLIFADEAARDEWVNYLYGPEVTNPGYVYLQGNVLVQLSAELDEGEAVRFRAALALLDR
ncbi:MAG: hypothetical protein JW910_11295 [Anaerolineae bacterium]|nr:hypothetical protein [Anaerolineae bacterium]